MSNMYSRIGIIFFPTWAMFRMLKFDDSKDKAIVYYTTMVRGLVFGMISILVAILICFGLVEGRFNLGLFPLVILMFPCFSLN